MNWLATLLDFITDLWPFTVIDQWERGELFYFGRPLEPGWLSRLAGWVGMPFRDEEGHLLPGLYFHIPWFSDLLTTDIVPVPLGCQLLNITLSDEKTLGFSMTYVVQVVDTLKALTRVDEYKESTGEIVTAVVAEKLADVDAERLSAEKRKRLVTDLVRWCNDETLAFGVKVCSIRFTNFAINQRAYRLLTDTALGPIAWKGNDD
jgi:regulator of protease activity HflC (stomatin/prohibitin superfamily)